MELIKSSFAFGIGTQELIIIVVLVLLLFGGTKIPQLMKGLGRGVGEFQKGLDDGKKALNSATTSSSSSTTSNRDTEDA